MARNFEPTAEGLSLLAPYWSSIVSARQQGYRSYEMWSILNEQFQEGGPAYAGATIFDLNRMWQKAGDLLNAEAAFAAEPKENPVNSQMWAWAPWAAESTAAWQTPNYMINYAYYAADTNGEILTDLNGDPLRVWGATDWQGSLDVLVSDIEDRVLQSAQAALDTGSPGHLNQLGDAGPVSIAGIAAVQILRF